MFNKKQKLFLSSISIMAIFILILGGIIVALMVGSHKQNQPRKNLIISPWPTPEELKNISTTNQSLPKKDIKRVIYKQEFNSQKLEYILLRSEDDGKTWKRIMTNYKSRIIYATGGKGNKFIYIGSYSGNKMAENLDIKIMKSIDAGDTWIDISRGVIIKKCESNVCHQYLKGTKDLVLGVENISVDENNLNKIELKIKINGEKIVVFNSIDGGFSWIRKNENE